jgi:hypothetical protein
VIGPDASYQVLIGPHGEVNCTCPAWNSPEKCKHTEALTAAGLLPTHFIKLLTQKQEELTKLCHDASEENAIHCHDMKEAQEKIADLEWRLNSVSDRALQLQDALAVHTAVPPKRTRTRKPKAAA